MDRLQLNEASVGSSKPLLLQLIDDLAFDAPACREAVIRALKQGSVDPNCAEASGRSALMAACEHGLDMVAALLLTQGADPTHTVNIDGALQSPLLLAARRGNISLVSTLLYAGASPALHGQEAVLAAVDDRLYDLETGVAAFANDPEALEDLAHQRAHAQATRRLLAGWFESAQQLQRQAPGVGSVVVTKPNVATARAAAAEHSMQSVQEAEWSAQLPLCVASGDAEMLRQLLDSCPSPHTFHTRLQNPNLTVAALQGNLEVLRVLVEKGANVNATDENGSTVLCAAAGMGRLEAIQYLLDHGAHVNRRNFSGYTPLSLAARRNQPAAVAALLAAGANCRIANYGGQTAMTAAAEGSNGNAVRCMEVLLTAEGGEALIDQPDAAGVTPLMIAALRRQDDCLEFLLSRGADVNRRTVGGMTALIAAAHGGSVRACKLLVAAGADLHVRQADGATALDVARRKGAPDGLLRILKGDGQRLAKGVRRQPLQVASHSQEEADRIAAELLAEEEAEKQLAQKQAAKVKKNKTRQQQPRVARAEKEQAEREAAAAQGGKQEAAAAEETVQAERGEADAQGSAGSASTAGGTAVPAAVAGREAAAAAGEGATVSTQQASSSTSSAPLPPSGAPQRGAAGTGGVHQARGTSASASKAPAGAAASASPAPPSSSSHPAPAAAAPQPQVPTWDVPSPAPQPSQQQCQDQGQGQEVAFSDDMSCVVCMDSLRCIAFVPCGHVPLCEECSEAVQAASNECPLCRCPIDVALKLSL